MAAVDFFLKIDGIPGESKDSAHQGEIDVLSYGWGVTQGGTNSAGGGGGAGKASHSGFHFVMKVNTASAKLMQACTTGKHISSAVLTVRKAGTNQQDYVQITLTNLIISSFQSGGLVGDDLLPTEQFSVDFAKIHYAYAPQKDDGELAESVRGGWDFQSNATP